VPLALVNLPAFIPLSEGTTDVVILLIPDAAIEGAISLTNEPMDDKLIRLRVGSQILSVHVLVVRHYPQHSACEPEASNSVLLILLGIS